jgi:hypothetical protein
MHRSLFGLSGATSPLALPFTAADFAA